MRLRPTDCGLVVRDSPRIPLGLRPVLTEEVQGREAKDAVQYIVMREP